MFKKVAIVLSFIMCITTVNINAAEDKSVKHQYTKKADMLKDLGLFKGSNNGYELDREPLRIESAVMLVRLLGKEDKALNGEYNHPFTDVPTWATKYIGYMYENGLTKGIGNNLFGSTMLTDSKSYATFVLRALGYDDSKGDFSWITALDIAVAKNIISADEKARLDEVAFLRDDMVNFSANALTIQLNNSSKKLINSLVEEGAVDGEKALANQLVDENWDFSLGLITNVAGINDNGFNEKTWEGLLRFQEEYGRQIQYIESSMDIDYVENMKSLVEAGHNLIIVPGFLLADALVEVAALYPEQKFAIIDMVVSSENVTNIIFAEEEGSFLAGVAAAEKAKEAGKDTVGFIGGYDFDLIQKFEAGFEAGVKAVDSDMTVLVEYTQDFNDEEKGRSTSSYMYDQGAYIIYHATGLSGNGIIKEAMDRQTNGEEVWVIGVDVDQYEQGLMTNGRSVVLTSMLKRVDNAAYSLSEWLLNDESHEGERIMMNLEYNGLSLSTANDSLSEQILESVNEYSKKVINGSIEVPTVPSRLE